MATREFDIVETYNLPQRSKLVYEKHLYELPQCYAVIQNVKAVYIVIVLNRTLKQVLNERYQPIDPTIKLDLDSLGDGLYVFEIVKQNKYLLLTDMFIENDQRITSPHWCVRWHNLNRIKIPRIKTFGNAQALRYDLNNARGFLIIRNVINTTIDHLYSSDRPKTVVIFGTGLLDGQLVTLVAGNVSGELKPVAFVKKSCSTFYGTTDYPNVGMITNIKRFNEPKLAMLKHFDLNPQNKITELQQKNLIESTTKFESLTYDYPLVLYNSIILTRLDQPISIVQRDVTKTKTEILFRQQEADAKRNLEIQYLEANASLF